MGSFSRVCHSVTANVKAKQILALTTLPPQIRAFNAFVTVSGLKALHITFDFVLCSFYFFSKTYRVFSFDTVTKLLDNPSYGLFFVNARKF